MKKVFLFSVCLWFSIQPFAQPSNLSPKYNSCPLPVITPGGSTTFCTGDSVVLSTTPGMSSYWWSNGLTTPSITVTTSGSYWVQVTDNTGCIAVSLPVTVTVSSAVPAQPGSITGNGNICSGTSQTYSVAPVAGATGYSWTLPPGWIGTSTTNTINVIVGVATGTIMVKANNGCGSSADQIFPVVVKPVPAQPSAISGNTTVCAFSIQTFSVVQAGGLTSYVWSLPSGWSGSSTGNSITALVGMTGGTVSVLAVNSCGISPGQHLNITVNTSPSQPFTILGSTSICANSVSIYSVSPVTGATSYDWVLPTGWSGTSNTDSISVTSGTAGGQISVSAVNSCGQSPVQVLAVNITPVPEQPSVINGNSSVITGQTITYSINPVNAATNYDWTLNGGGSIVNSPILTADVNWTTAGVYNLSVNAANTCGNSSDRVLAITVSNPTGIINPDDAFNITVVPNPTNGQFMIKAKGGMFKTLLVDVMSISGQSIYKNAFKSTSREFSEVIHIEKYAAGVYTVKMIVDGKLYVRQVTKLN